MPVSVDSHYQRPEVLDAKLPEAFGHEVLPPDVFDLFDLHGLECCRAADDGQVGAAQFFHGLDARFEQSAFAYNCSDLVALKQAGYKAIHARAGCCSNGKLFVSSIRQFLDPRCCVQAHRASEVHGRVDAFIEDADLRSIADPKDRAADEYGILELESAYAGLVERRSQDVFCHAASPFSFVCEVLFPADLALSVDDDLSSFSAPTLDVDGHWVLTDVRMSPLDVYGHRRGRSA